MSRERKERLKQLENERSHFYRNRSSHLVSSEQPESSHEEDYYQPTDFTGIRTKLDTSSGKHLFVEGFHDIRQLQNPIETELRSSNMPSSSRYNTGSQQKQSKNGNAFDRLVAKESKSRSKVFVFDVVFRIGQNKT
jgi:hypothetical protein